MRSLVRPKLILTLIAIVMVASVTVSPVISTIHAPVAHAAALNFPATGELDCNGYSQIQQPLKRNFPCADITGRNGERGEDNGHYIGHDEPSAQFLSNTPGSGNNVRWEITLPQEHALPATQTFENQGAFWFSMALCEPTSFPLHPCLPDSDKNPPSRFSNDPTVAGSAILELQFYPPGFYPYLTQLSCDATHWCAAMTIDSLKCDPQAVSCNRNCTEPANFAFIQKDGIPLAPPGPASATKATLTPNAQTLLMNQGDKIKITMHDTVHGVINRVADKTTGQSGFMIASAQNGFESLDVHTCKPTTFDFHPEFQTARLHNVVSWMFLEANIGIAFELGHFEVGAHGDGDRDDGACFPGPTVPGCLGADLDYDGTSYQPDWPDGTRNTPTSIQISPPRSASWFGQYVRQYPSLMLETEIFSTESTCHSDGSGCRLPPPGASFYPFFAQSVRGTSCTLTFGNDIRGATINDFEHEAQYGRPELAWFWGTASSGIRPNPCQQEVT